MGIPEAARAASQRWADELAAWAIPDDILKGAPESPWGFPIEVFSRAATRALADTDLTPSRLRAAERLRDGDSVLDVGAGGGAASLPLAPPAGLLVAVDESSSMLAHFADSATRIGVAHVEVVGRWPEIAPQVDVANVVVCHHVVYNVGDLAGLLVALDGHARRRVVVELTARHPQSDLNGLWRAIHGIDRPRTPVATEAADVAVALGYDVHVERFERPSMWDEAPRSERIAFARRRLCVGPEHDDAIGAFCDATVGDSRELVTMWWDPQP